MNKEDTGHFRWSRNGIRFLTFIPILSVALFLAFVYLLYSGVVNREDYWQVQVAYFVPLNHYLSSLPTFWQNLTQLGDAFVLFPLLSVFLLYRPQVWIALFSALPLGILLSQAGKALAGMPRPAAVLHGDQITTIGHALTAHTSLPSGHTVTVFAAITVIMGVYIPLPKKFSHFVWLFLAGVIASTLALSRVAVGAHWPIDIFVGSIFGYFAGISGIWITQCNQNCWHWLSEPKAQFIVGGIMLVWSVSLARYAFKPTDHFLFVIWLSALVGFMVSLYLISRRFVVPAKTTV